MRISVIVPVYNAEEYLAECIESILRQTFGDFELLLVNDGSRDGSADICRRYAAADSRIRFFDMPNRGVSAARNLGLDEARGEWLAFADADDTVTPEWLERLAAGAASETTLSVGNFTELRGNRSVTPAMRDGRAGGGFAACLPLLTELYRYRWLNLVWNKLFSRAIVSRCGLRFDEHLRYGVDIVFVIGYCAHITDIAVDSRPTYLYRFVAGSVSHRQIGAQRITDTKNAVLAAFTEHGYGDECLYLTNRVYWSRLRRELRNETNPATMELLAKEILAVAQGMKRHRRLRFFRQTYDWKTALTSGIATLGGSTSWVKFAVRVLHL